MRRMAITLVCVCLLSALCGCRGEMGKYYVEQYQSGMLVRSFRTDNIDALPKGFTYKIKTYETED